MNHQKCQICKKKTATAYINDTKPYDKADPTVEALNEMMEKDMVDGEMSENSMNVVMNFIKNTLDLQTKFVCDECAMKYMEEPNGRNGFIGSL